MNYVNDSFSNYQHFTGATAIYPKAKAGTIEAVNYLTLGMTGEAGEVANKVKKISRDNGGVITDEHRSDLLKEMGDVMWYLTRLIDELGGEVGVVAQDNVDKLLDRRDRGVIQGSGDSR